MTTTALPTLIRTLLQSFCPKAVLLPVALFSLGGRLNAQERLIRGTVTNRFSKERIAFASVSWKHAGYGVLTDSSGAFGLIANTGNDTLIASFVGFSTLSIPFSPADTGIVQIELEPKQGTEVIVSAKYDRGLLWWKKIVKHKDRNNPYAYNSCSFRLYKKLEIDLNHVNRERLESMKLLKPFGFILQNVDSSLPTQPRLPVFLTESLSRFYISRSPAKKREEISARQTNGIRNEAVLQFIDGFSQEVNVYENAITLFGKTFISPLSSYGSGYYRYRAADTQYIGGQPWLHLLFSPRRAGENTFSGDCWVHPNSWAVRQINLSVSSSANINYVNSLDITQEFTQLSDGTWIFAKDRFEADLSPVRKSRMSLFARQTSVYNEVQINEPGIVAALEKNSSAEQVLLDDSARTRTGAYWQQVRPVPLAASEQKVYNMMDTLQQMPVFRHYTNAISLVTDGHIKLGKIEIGPWYKWVSSNQHEKVRGRFDIGTTEKFSPYLGMRGYLAYGFGNSNLNGRLGVTYRFPGNSGYSVHASYVHDLDNGRPKYNEEDVAIDNMFSQLIRKPGLRQKFIQVNEIKAGVTKAWESKFSAGLSLSRTSYETFNPLPPKRSILADMGDIVNAELGIRLRYAPGERSVVTYRKERKIRGRQPATEMRYTMGLPGVWGARYRYQKLTATVSQALRLPGWGKLDYRVYAGKIWGAPLPFMLLELHPGNETFYYSKYAFNLMNRFEYFSDRYAGFAVEHNFEKKLLNLVPFLRRVNVRQFWNLKSVWGDMSPANKRLNRWSYGNYHMKSLRGNPYFEAGTGFDNICKYFRVDMVWRFVPQLNPLPAGVHPPTTPDFGIFGSMHVQF